MLTQFWKRKDFIAMNYIILIMRYIMQHFSINTTSDHKKALPYRIKNMPTINISSRSE